MTDDRVNIEFEGGTGGGRYHAEVTGGTAELTYVAAGSGIIIVNHTYVPPAARGGKVAEQLVEHAVAKAREAGQKIVPQCPYVDKLFRRRPDLDERRAE